jgi:hypothetical protein
LQFADLFLTESESILLIRYHNDTEIDLEKAKQVIEKVKPIIVNTRYGMTDARGNGLYISREARNLYKDNPSMRANKAHAVIVNSLSTRMLANFFVKVDKPVSPTKVFNEFEPAIKWLKEY